MSTPRFKLFLAALLLMATFGLTGVAQARASDKATTQFGLTGDNAYFVGTETLFDQLINDLNSQPIRSVLHAGDFLGLQACTDSSFDTVLGQFNRSTHPLIYTPGDNEWSDCYNQPLFGGTPRDPADALTSLRNKFFPSRGKGLPSQGESLGQKRISLKRQSKHGDDPATSFNESKFVENQMWTDSGVLFVTVNVGGAPDESPDNCLQRVVVGGVVDHIVGDLSNVPQSCSPEKLERQAADIAWLQQAFAAAKGLLGVVILQQAEMFWDVVKDDGTCPAVNSVLRDGSVLSGPSSSTATNSPYTACKIYEPYRVALRDLASSFEKPVALMWGDAHFFRYFKPMADVPNLVGVQTVGSPSLGWTRAQIDRRESSLFNFSVGSCIPGPITLPGVLNKPAPPNCDFAVAGVKVLAPESLAGNNFEGFEGWSPFTPEFGRPLVTLPDDTLTGEVVPVGSSCPGTAPVNLAGKIALIDSGDCPGIDPPFLSTTFKVLMAQLEGAVGVIRANDSDTEQATPDPSNPFAGTDLLRQPIGFSTLLPFGLDLPGFPINIPVIGIKKTIADRIKAAGSPVTVRITSQDLALRELVQIHG